MNPIYFYLPEQAREQQPGSSQQHAQMPAMYQTSPSNQPPSAPFSMPPSPQPMITDYYHPLMRQTPSAPYSPQMWPAFQQSNSSFFPMVPYNQSLEYARQFDNQPQQLREKAKKEQKQKKKRPNPLVEYQRMLADAAAMGIPTHNSTTGKPLKKNELKLKIDAKRNERDAEMIRETQEGQ